MSYEPPQRKRSGILRVPDRLSSCTRKSPYETEPQAIVAARSYERERNIKLWHYFCIYCEMWHLTSQAPKGN
jgi:hypothetical protein